MLSRPPSPSSLWPHGSPGAAGPSHWLSPGYSSPSLSSQPVVAMETENSDITIGQGLGRWCAWQGLVLPLARCYIHIGPPEGKKEGQERDRAPISSPCPSLQNCSELSRARKIQVIGGMRGKQYTLRKKYENQADRR